MTRVATIPLQRTMSDAIQRSQQKLAVTQTQLVTGKKATTLAQLGSEAVRNLSARSLVSAQKAHVGVATQLGTTLSFYDTNISGVETVATDLHQSILTTIGLGDGTGLQDTVEAAFNQFRSLLNASNAGVPLFSGSQASEPFTPTQLSDTVGLSAANAFINDDVRASARAGDGIDIEYGVTATDVGSDLFAAFRTLAEAGSIGNKPTAAQVASLKTALGQIDTALGNVRAVNANNGRKQAQVETLGIRAEQRTLVLNDIISKNEDADLGQIAIDLAQQQSVLEASYSVFSKLSGLNLSNYLR